MLIPGRNPESPPMTVLPWSQLTTPGNTYWKKVTRSGTSLSCPFLCSTR